MAAAVTFFYIIFKYFFKFVSNKWIKTTCWVDRNSERVKEMKENTKHVAKYFVKIYKILRRHNLLLRSIFDPEGVSFLLTRDGMGCYETR